MPKMLTDHRNMRRYLDDEFLKLPEQLKAPLSRCTVREKSVWEIMCLAHVQLHWLHHHYLLERLEYAGRDEERHLEIARDMLDAVLALWSHRDRFPEHRDDVHWVVRVLLFALASLGDEDRK